MTERNDHDHPLFAASALDYDLPLAPQIARLLRRAIVTLNIEPGERLSEQEVANAFGLNRHAIREAFLLLRDSGLIRVMPQRGTMVLKISPESLGNASFVREALECAAARAAAVLRDPTALARLEANLTVQRQLAKQKNPEAFFECDDSFHHLIAEAAGRSIAWNIVDDFKPQLDRLRYLSIDIKLKDRLTADTAFENSLHDHQAIVAAIKNGDADEAELQMRNHLGRIMAALPRLASSYPDMFASDPHSKSGASAQQGQGRRRVGRANQTVRSI
jgi:GntR family transcriptional regulator, rspAB operon transcriptional repressor